MCDFLAGGLASAVAEVLTLPMDTVKVRMQLHHSTPTGMLSVSRKMLSEEGLSSFFFGLEPAVIRQLTYGSLRYGLYPSIKTLVEVRFPALSPFSQKLLSGMLAGSVSSALCNPTDLIKVRMQANNERNNTTFFGCFQHILKEEGVLALYQGVFPTICRASVLAAVEMSCYETFKNLFKIYLFGSSWITGLPYSSTVSSVLVIVFASMLASFFSSFASSPFDVIRSRLMAQSSKRRSRAGSLAKAQPSETNADCLQKSFKSEGFTSFWSGFWALYFRLGPNTILTFLFIEIFGNFFRENFKCR